jgi:hypothetical protein
VIASLPIVKTRGNESSRASGAGVATGIVELVTDVVEAFCGAATNPEGWSFGTHAPSMVPLSERSTTFET